ncbi:ASCH domain protein [Nocardioides panacihumi]|uniref:ASCH domain protein n=1 Tax=Nocardioides panacihumi TaxID=400774 RepID=A0ABN2QNE3_9ACTN
MSIHPQYAQAIMAGTKKVEFRKRRIADDVTHVIVYATAPVSAVVGVFEVSGQTTTTPTSLWRRFKKVAGISRDGFDAYFEGRDSATGITVGDVTVLDEPLCLQGDLGIGRPPQSYQYVNPTGLPVGLVPASA